MWGVKVQPCGKEVSFDCIKKGTDARAEGNGVDPLFEVFFVRQLGQEHWLVVVVGRLQSPLGRWVP